METLGVVLIVAGWLVCAAGGLWLVVLAFQTSIGWGIGSLLVPFVSWIFAFTHWVDAKKPFLISLAGIPFIVIGKILTHGN